MIPQAHAQQPPALGAERLAYHLELFRKNAPRYSLGVRQNLDTAIKNMNDTAGQPCSEKVIDYVTAQWRLISIRKNIDAAFTNFDLVALPTMRITPRTINDSLNREEEPKPREPEVISNCTPFNIFGLPRHLDPMWFFERRTSDRIDDCRSAVLRRKSARARKCV